MAGNTLGGQASRVAKAYDAIAPRYDQYLQRESWMRQVLWRHYDNAFRSGQHVLDLACGTGIDTLFLARRGIRVTAIDASEGMLEQLERKIRQFGLESRIDVRRGDIGTLEPDEFAAMDGIVSGFAGLNTVENLRALVDNAATWLRPDGRFVVQLLTRDGVMSRSRLRADRPADDETTTIAVSGEPVDHLCLPAAEIYGRYFAARFLQRRACGLGFLIPAPLLARLPAGLLPWVGRVEARVGLWGPFLERSRFCIMDLQRRPDAADPSQLRDSQHGQSGN